MRESVFENRRPYSNAEDEVTGECTEPRQAKEMYHDSQSVLSFSLNKSLLHHVVRSSSSETSTQNY